MNVHRSRASVDEVVGVNGIPFEIVINFKYPEVKPKLQKLNEINPKLTQLLSSDQIADALIQVMPNCSDFIQECWWQAC